MLHYRLLTDKEIATLTVYGCSAEDWKSVEVVDDFSPNFFSNVHFSGNIKLGTYNKVFELAGGVKKHAGIYNCHLHNCNVGNDVFIDKIHNYIANYEIGAGTYIENVNLILTEGESSFGNGCKVLVMIEAGGREMPIFNELSAPLAYIFTFYRHNVAVIENIKVLIQKYVATVTSNIARIGNNVRIVNSDTLKNVCVGDGAVVESVTLLENGTINSSELAPVYIGYGVQCSNFIVNSGSRISESAIISNCFIGQACIIGKQFSAIDSLFFANSQGLHGEAVSVFAGPYTVTHHKSTLMLTALYSFMNAGSGTNFSNHMYKLGPVHQGVTARGVKTSSDSYVMWPANIGAFTVVLGRHKGNPDISDLPFSYLIETDGESNLMVGVNLHSAGTVRDVEKWAKRDNRLGAKMDDIHFDFLSPYTLSKVLKGIDILKSLLHNMDATTNFVWYQNCKIKRSAIRKGIELYEMAIDQYIGDSFVAKIQALNSVSFSNVQELLYSKNENIGVGEWSDLAGLLAPASMVDELLTSVEDNILNLNELQLAIKELYTRYGEFSWTWVLDVFQKKYSKSLSEFAIEDLVLVLTQWKKSFLYFDSMVLKDAKKEFNLVSQTGFGLDGDAEMRIKDFEMTRGSFEQNAFVAGFESKMNKKIEIADSLLAVFK